MVGRGFLPWNGLKVFHVKNRVFLTLFYSAVSTCLLPSHEQAFQSGAVGVCEKLLTTLKTQFTPLLCFVLIILTDKARRKSLW